MAWTHSDKFPYPALATMSAHVSDLVEHPDCPHSIPVSYRDGQPSSPCHHHHPSTWLPIRTPSAIGVSTADHRVHLCATNHPRVRREERLVSHVGVTDSLNLMSNNVFQQGSSGGNSTYNDLLASPYKKAVLTSANMIDLFAPFSHLVIAREVTVRIAIRPGVPAHNSPRLSPALNSRASRRALAIGCSSVPLFVMTHSFVRDNPLHADHFSFFIPFHGFSCKNTIHLHSLVSLHLLEFCFNHQFLTHMSLRVPCGKPRHNCKFHHLLQHPHSANMQSRDHVRGWEEEGARRRCSLT